MSNSVELVVVADGPEKFNDAENPVSNTTRPAGSGTSKPKVLSTFELWSHIAIYICLIICVFFFAAFIVAYFVFDREFRERVNAIDNTCSNNDEYADLLAKPPRQRLSYFAYNLSNPYEYVNGKTAQIHELGPYGMSLLPVRNNVDFVKSEGTVTFNLYNDITYDDEESCSDCDIMDKVYVPNVPYLALFSNAQNEGSLILSMTCSATQIALIRNPGAASFCLPAQLNTAASCICCSAAVPTPSGAIACSSLLRPTTRPAGIISWLSKYDNAWKLRNSPTSFALVNEIFTPLIRRLAVSEVVFGTVSSLIGFLRTNEAITKSDFTTLYENSNTTADLQDACVSVCPTLTQVRTRFLQAIGSSTPFTQVDYACNGVVPPYEDLISIHGEERALELRYLEGVDCKPFSTTLALNGLLLADPNPNTKICADGSNLTLSRACCLKQFRSTTFSLSGRGLGCQFWVNGLVQSRRVYSDAEAVAYLKPSPKTQFYSGCADGKYKFQQNIWRGQEQMDGWFTPVNYQYPNMSWADPTVVKTGRAKVAGTGTMVPFKVSGYQAGIRPGKGVTTRFGVYQLTDGKPLYEESDVWAPFKLGVTPVIYEKNRKVDGLETNHFIPNTKHSSDPAVIEEQQKRGILPYQNMFNLVYSLNGIPVIMTYPNFYESDPQMLTQSDNRERKSTSTSGVSLYRTRDGYGPDSTRLSSPTPITTDTWDEYGAANFRGYLDIEPATGLTLEGKIANQFSVYTWNCNPTLDPSCQFIRNATFKCYTNGVFPCSFANVFTPKVMGGKILPVYWLYTTPGAPTKATDGLADGVDARYSLSVLVIFVPITSFLVALLFLYCLFHHSKHASTQVPTTEKE